MPKVAYSDACLINNILNQEMENAAGMPVEFDMSPDIHHIINITWAFNDFAGLIVDTSELVVNCPEFKEHTLNSIRLFVKNGIPPAM